MNKIKTRTDLINYIINKYNYIDYLEIGIRNPNDNFFHINIENKTAVDPFPKGYCDYIMTSDNFFKVISDNIKYDLIFIDGLHTAEQVYIDIINSIKHLNDNGIIVIHDCNPPTEFHTRSYDEYKLNGGEWNGDVFKGFIKYKQENLNYTCFVVDVDFGCGIISKKNILKNEIYQINDNLSDWNLFDINRHNLLQLINLNDFINIL